MRSSADINQNVLDNLITSNKCGIKSGFNNISLEVLVSILSLYGKCSFTSFQYDFMRSVLNIFDSPSFLPSLSSIRKVKWPYFCSHLFPRSFIKSFSSRKTNQITITVVSRDPLPITNDNCSQDSLGSIFGDEEPEDDDDMHENSGAY